jgi:hypothetical protein
VLRAPRWRVARQPRGAFGTVRTRIRCPFIWRFYLEVASRSIAKRNLLRACGVHPERWSRRQTRSCAAACSWPGPRRSPPIVPKPPMDSAAPDGRCGQLVDGLGEVDQNCPPLERARPQAAHSDLGQAFGSLRLAHRRLDKPALLIAASFPMEGAGLPTLPTGTTAPNFLIFREERTGAIQKSTGPAAPLRRRALRYPRPWKASGPCSRS